MSDIALQYNPDTQRGDVVRDGADFRKSFERDRHAQHVSDPVVPGSLNYFFQVAMEGIEIEMTVGINE